MSQLPRLVSPDDHIQAPPHLWQTYLPERYRADGPQIKRLTGFPVRSPGNNDFREDPDGTEADVWHYNGQKVPCLLIAASAGVPRDQVSARPMTFDEMRPGFYEPKARLEDMDEAGVEASVCYPNMFLRFAGQTLSLASDKELALECIKAYNNFVDQEWCGDSGGRLVRLGIVPLWDVELAVAETKRIAALGFRTISFSEQPHLLGLPSIFSGYWDPLFAELEANDMVLSLHIGTGGFPMLASDMVSAVGNTVISLNSAYAITDWMFSGLLEKFPRLKLCVAESQLGWVPYILERADFVWHELSNEGFTGIDRTKMPHPPSFYFHRNIWVTFFRDEFGIDNLYRIGADKVLYEVDYPHTDSPWPDCASVAAELTANLSKEDAAKVVAGNCKKLFNIETSPANEAVA